MPSLGWLRRRMRSLCWLLLLLPLVAGIHPECKIFQQLLKEEALCSEQNESLSPALKGFLQRNCTQEAQWSEPFPPYTVACGFDEGSSKGPEDQKSYYSAFWRVYTAGYAASVTSLLTALIVFAAFRKFHCTRNYIHMHLFVSFILRAIAVFTKDAVLFADETMDHCLMSTVQTELKKQLCKWQHQEYLTFTHKHGALSRENSPVNYVTQLSLLEKISPQRKTSVFHNGVTTV
ncbi:hypothetical protein WISP_18527 [Willisornis vidua]|uniref:G-protein coupled receptors family 2 profile 2 domain-containing protein n=1 Tax=Willisornis vidua TaxID=1566151 RepID=A0ABQ9DUM6_9PASS|nr:hypothetical protein WISP_18527 [Willisornis vidua]